MIDAPSYTLNHEEVAKALEEGIRFAESADAEGSGSGPVRPRRGAALVKTAAGETRAHAGASRFWSPPERSPIRCSGAKTRTNVFLDGKWFQAVDEDGQPVKPERVAKPAQASGADVDSRGRPRHQLLRRSASVLRRQRGEGHGQRQAGLSGGVAAAGPQAAYGARAGRICSTKLNDELRAVVHDVVRLTPNIVEVIVKAPMAARAFQPGQFYRLQNYETLAPRVERNRAGDGRTRAHRRVGRSRERAALDHRARDGRVVRSVRAAETGRAGDPDGSHRHADGNAERRRPRLLVGGGLGNAVLFSIGQQLRAQGSRTIYFAGYKKIIDRYKVEEIEKAADVVVWCCDEAPGFTPGRVQDKAFVGNIVEAIGPTADAATWPRQPRSPLHSVDRLIVIGSDGMMGAVARARHTVLAPYLKPDHKAIGSINSPDAVHDERDLRAVPAAAQGSR